MRQIDQDRRPPPLRQSLARLDLPTLRRQAADTADAHTSRAARRMISIASTHTGYYAPEEALQRGQPARALAHLRIAEQINPGDAFLCRRQLLAHTLLRAPLPIVRDFTCIATDFTRAR